MSRRRTLIELVERFWQRVDKSGECWLWTGELNSQGYGFYMIYEGGGREKMLAHRFAALMAGMPVCTGTDVVMHQCDTPRCVRPAHLSVGTQMENLRDAMQKNRMDLTGLSAPIIHTCKGCGDEFLGTPNERYCPDHKPRRTA
jgi:hypothetical protein